MSRAVNCSSQKQGHTDAAFNWCGKEIALVGFGKIRMGVLNLYQSASSMQNQRKTSKARTRPHAPVYTLAITRPACVTVLIVASEPKFRRRLARMGRCGVNSWLPTMQPIFTINWITLRVTFTRRIPRSPKKGLVPNAILGSADCQVCNFRTFQKI